MKDDNLPPDDRTQGATPGGETPPGPGEGVPDAEPLSVEEAEARLRDFAALADAPPEYPPAPQEPYAGHEPEYQHEHYHDEHYRGEYGYSHDHRRGGSSVWRWVVRIAVPIVFLGGVIAIVLVVLNSGVLDGTGAAVSPSPSISPSKSATVVTVRVYKIKKGDTLSQIAERFGTTVDKILEANPTIDINSLSVGLKVKIPPPE
jgi:LysM repeat protein